MNSPTQKALIQFAESMAITALIAGIASIGTLLVGNGTIDWTQVGITFSLAVVFSLAHSLSAYLKATPTAQQGQPDYSALGTVLDAFLNTLQQRVEAAQVPVVAQPQPAQQAAPKAPLVPPGTPVMDIPANSSNVVTQPAQIDWSATNPAFKAVNLVPPAQQQ
jgi:hypothetical protein